MELVNSMERSGLGGNSGMVLQSSQESKAGSGRNPLQHHLGMR